MRRSLAPFSGLETSNHTPSSADFITITQEGKVVAVGPGARREDGSIAKLDVKVGDRVLYGKWSGTEIKIKGEELMIMKESDIMGIVS